MPDINFWAVLASGIAAMVVGYLWYGPIFGKKWAKSIGISEWSEEKFFIMEIQNLLIIIG